MCLINWWRYLILLAGFRGNAPAGGVLAQGYGFALRRFISDWRASVIWWWAAREARWQSLAWELLFLIPVLNRQKSPLTGRNKYTASGIMEVFQTCPPAAPWSYYRFILRSSAHLQPAHKTRRLQESITAPLILKLVLYVILHLSPHRIDLVLTAIEPLFLYLNFKYQTARSIR